MIPTIAAACRRLHDTNRSGWWQLLPMAGGIVAGFGVMQLALGKSAVPLIIGVVLALGLAIFLLVWLATDGDKGDNRFGPDPKGPPSYTPDSMAGYAPNRPAGNKRLFD